MEIDERVSAGREQIDRGIDKAGVASAMPEGGRGEAMGGNVGEGGAEDGGFGFGERWRGRVFVRVVGAAAVLELVPPCGWWRRGGPGTMVVGKWSGRRGGPERGRGN